MADSYCAEIKDSGAGINRRGTIVFLQWLTACTPLSAQLADLDLCQCISAMADSMYRPYRADVAVQVTLYRQCVSAKADSMYSRGGTGYLPVCVDNG
jgi:hypothetical protein